MRTPQTRGDMRTSSQLERTPPDDETYMAWNLADRRTFAKVSFQLLKEQIGFKLARKSADFMSLWTQKLLCFLMQADMVSSK